MSQKKIMVLRAKAIDQEIEELKSDIVSEYNNIYRIYELMIEKEQILDKMLYRAKNRNDLIKINRRKSKEV